MKKIHIIGIAVIAVLLAIMVSTISDSSTYVNFTKAREHEGKKYHVVGVLNRDKEFIYNPEKNANLFGFYMVDTEGKEMKVLYNDTKPQDFEKSEQIVVIGKVVGNEFHVKKGDLLMKCPSKYNGSEYQQQELMGEEFVRPV
jgi:cytochrome c-type biogenesis protein CcmE